MATCAFDTLFTKNVPHILEIIFLSLDYESFKTCMEVCDPWKKYLTSAEIQKKGKPVFSEGIVKVEKKLSRASKRGRTEDVRRLLSIGMGDFNLKNGYKVNKGYKLTPLHWAIGGGHKEIVQLLLDAGADLNEGLISAPSYTPLYLAAVQKDIVQLLLDRGADPDGASSDFGNRTPLLRAVEEAIDSESPRQKECKDVVKLLLNRGADPNRTDYQSNTPLHKAVWNGSKDVVQLLLSGGADPNVINLSGRTPLSLARFLGHKDIETMLN